MDRTYSIAALTRNLFYIPLFTYHEAKHSRFSIWWDIVRHKRIYDRMAGVQHGRTHYGVVSVSTLCN